MVMLLEGLDDVNGDAPAPVVAPPKSALADKISGFLLLAGGIYVIWGMFQPGGRRSRRTVNGLGDPPTTHRLRASADQRRAEDSVVSAHNALEKNRCVDALWHAGDALISAGAAMAEARGVGDVADVQRAGSSLRLAVAAHRAAVKACVRKV